MTLAEARRSPRAFIVTYSVLYYLARTSARVILSAGINRVR